nr:MAG TPA: hypothetical protein [Caudoviricetes sp.]
MDKYAKCTNILVQVCMTPLLKWLYKYAII